MHSNHLLPSRNCFRRNNMSCRLILSNLVCITNPLSGWILKYFYRSFCMLEMPTWFLLSLLNFSWYSTSCRIYCRHNSNGRTSAMCSRYILANWSYHSMYNLSGRKFLWILCNPSIAYYFKLMSGWVLLSFYDHRLYVKLMLTWILLSGWKHSTNHVSSRVILW